MLMKNHKISFVFLMTSAFVLSTATAYSSSAVQPASQADKPVPVTIGMAKDFTCPKELEWAALNDILVHGVAFGNHTYTPINADDFKKSLPGGHNVITKRMTKPAFTQERYIMTPDYRVQHQCTYKYHTLASGLGSMVKGGEGYELGIKTDTGMRVTTLQIHNDATHEISVNVFATDERGKNISNESLKIFKVAPKGVENNAMFITDQNVRYFEVQVAYQGLKGFTDCAYQQIGGKFNLNFTEKALGNACAIARTAQ